LKRILVVDDDEASRVLYAESLILAGYAVDSAGNGIEAIERMKGAEYDLIITDIYMPWLDGIELYRRVVEGRPEMRERFFFITGRASTDEVALLKKMRKCYLLKPFKIAEFIERVESQVGKGAPAAVGAGD